jgi:DeoD family purine-nucleoside phosphorylase
VKAAHLLLLQVYGEVAIPETYHIIPTAPLAERVLLPGDPGRALRLAQELLEQPRMLNHHRGLWGYTGTAHDGAELSIQSTGMGGPSLAIVVHELIALGARRLVRVGTCGALDPALALGDLLVATAALPADGTSRALGSGEGPVPASAGLLAALLDAAGERVARGPVASTDLFYGDGPPEREWRAAGALAVEMESAPLFALAARRGVQAGALLAVSDRLDGGRERIQAEALHEAERRMGALAAAALG